MVLGSLGIHFSLPRQDLKLGESRGLYYCIPNGYTQLEVSDLLKIFLILGLNSCQSIKISMHTAEFLQILKHSLILIICWTGLII